MQIWFYLAPVVTDGGHPSARSTFGMIPPVVHPLCTWWEKYIQVRVSWFLTEFSFPCCFSEQSTPHRHLPGTLRDSLSHSHNHHHNHPYRHEPPAPLSPTTYLTPPPPPSASSYIAVQRSCALHSRRVNFYLDEKIIYACLIIYILYLDSQDRLKNRRFQH